MTMPRRSHFESVIRALQRVKSVDSTGISEASRLKQDLQLDSIAIIDFFFEIEQETGFRISAVEISQRFGSNQILISHDFTIGELVSYIETQNAS